MERWKKVEEAPKYEVSNLGRVRRQWATRMQYLKPFLQGGDYRYPGVALSVNGKVLRRFVHVLVAQAFIGPCPPKMQVNHKDGNKLNPVWTNLEYVTNRGNALHASQLGLLVCGIDHASAKVTEAQVREIRQKASQGATFRSLAKEYGLTVGTVHPMVHHRTWKHLT